MLLVSESRTYKYFLTTCCRVVNFVIRLGRAYVKQFSSCVASQTEDGKELSASGAAGARIVWLRVSVWAGKSYVVGKCKRTCLLVAV